MTKISSHLVLLLLITALGACGGSGDDGPDLSDQEQIQQSLEEFLPRLAEAYASGKYSALEGWAAEKEIARVHKQVEGLRDQGRTLVPTFRRVTVEEVKIWNHSNAFVTTLEVWDIRSYASGTETVLGEELEQANRVKYQLKREGDRWRVLFRAKQE